MPGVAYNLCAMNELPYLQQIRGCLSDRPMVNRLRSEEELESMEQEEYQKCLDTIDKSKCYYGKVDDGNLQVITQMMNSYLREDEELQALREASEKSQQRFTQTRGTAVVDKENNEGLDLKTVHPLFWVKKDQKTVGQDDMLDRLKNYKAGRSYMEIKGLKDRSGEDKRVFTSVLKKMKGEVVTLRERKERMAKVHGLRKEEKEERERLEKLAEAESEVASEAEEGGEEYEFVIPDTLKNDFTGENAGNLKKRAPQGGRSTGGHKKVKKTDFRSKKLFISHEADLEKMKEFEDVDKIGFEDLNTMFMNKGDGGDDLVKRKKMVWDRTKMKYTQQLVDSRGVQINGGRLHEKANDKKVAGEKYKLWKRKNMMGFQKLGEQEDSGATARATSMFQERRKQVFRGESSYNYKGIYEPEKKSKKGNAGGSVGGKKVPVQSELKEFGTILKRKKKNKENTMLQMDKKGRGKILEKNKQAFKDRQAPTFKKGSVFNKPDAKNKGVKEKMGRKGPNAARSKSQK